MLSIFLGGSHIFQSSQFALSSLTAQNWMTAAQTALTVCQGNLAARKKKVTFGDLFVTRLIDRITFFRNLWFILSNLFLLFIGLN